MADDKKKDMQDFNNLAKQFEAINKEALKLTDRRLAVNKGLVDSVRELNVEAEKYNKIQGQSTSAWAKMVNDARDYSEEIKKTSETQEKLEKRKEDLSKRVGELKKKLLRDNKGEIKLSAEQRLLEEHKLAIAEENLKNIDKSIIAAKELNNNYKELNKNQSKFLADGKKWLSENADKFLEVFTFKGLVDAINESNKSTVELAKTIGGSIDDAADLKVEFGAIAMATNQAAINTKQLTQAYLDLSTNLKTTAGFSDDQLVAQTELTRLVKLQSKESSNLIGLGILNNKTNKEVTSEILDQVSLLEKETGIRIDGRKLLKEVANINGQLAAQYKFNNKLLAEAVMKLKEYGLTLQQAQNISSKLLDFEQSIAAELEAELLTGKQLNLEQARLLALQGDSAGAAAAVAEQFGSAAEFTSMNVLQQQKLAAAVGLTADQLANSIREREILRSLGAENLKQLEKEGRLQDLLTVKGGEQLYQQYQQQATAEKFADALDKIKSLVASLVEAFTPVINIINAVLDSSIAMGAVLGAVAGVTLLKAIAGFKKLFRLIKLIKLESIGAAIANIFAGNAKFGPLGIALAGAAVGALFAAMASAKNVDDMAYGDNMVITKNKGVFALNNDDQVIAGTNLFGNRGGGSNNNPMNEDRFIAKLAGAINNKKVHFDSFDASGPQGIVETDRRRQNVSIL